MPEPTPNAPKEQGENPKQAPAQTPEEARREEQKTEVREKFNGDLDEMKNEPFVLRQQLLEEYPEMKKLSGLPKKEAPQDTWEVSQVYVNGRTIDSWIKDVQEGKTKGNIEYLLKVVGDGLKELSALNKPEYQNFITKESAKLEKRKEEAKKAIGDKKRGSDEVYR